MKTLLIVPAYNEEASIGKTLDELAPYDFFDIVVIDDGSADATAEICSARGVKCIRLPFNMGLSGAFETGMRYAFRHGYDAAVQFDADGQHRPEYIAPLLEKIRSGGVFRSVQDLRRKTMTAACARSERPLSARGYGSRRGRK